MNDEPNPEDMFSSPVQQLLQEERDELQRKSEKIIGHYKSLDWKLSDIQRDTTLPPEIIIENARKVAHSYLIGITGLEVRDVVDILHTFYRCLYDERNAVMAIIKKQREGLAQLDTISAQGYDMSLPKAKINIVYRENITRLAEIDTQLRAWGLHPGTEVEMD